MFRTDMEGVTRPRDESRIFEILISYAAKAQSLWMAVIKQNPRPARRSTGRGFYSCAGSRKGVPKGAVYQFSKLEFN